jgi:yersiniabactin salicyl-AMP ligase
MKPWEEKTLFGLLEDTVKKHGEKLAVVDSNHEYTYEQLLEKVCKLSDYLYYLGFRKKDRVIVQIANSAMFEIVIFSLFKIGAVPILILPAHKEHVVDAICQRAEPVAYITMEDFYGTDYRKAAIKLKDKYSFIKHILTVSELEEIIEKENVERADTEPVSPRNLAFLSLSGGTTGIPKLIPRYNGEYCYNAICTAGHCKMDESTVNLTAIPAAHNFAFGTPGMIGTVYCGGLNVMCEYPSPLEIFDMIETHKVTMMSFVPSVVSLCIQYREIDESYDLSSIKYILVGGAMFTSEMAKKCEEILGGILIQVYGMSEGMTFLTDTKADDYVRFNTQGKPCAGEDEFKIVDEDFNPVPDGTEGEIVVKGPYTIHEYYRASKSAQSSFKDGYYRPGDKGIKDKTGNIIVTGRSKEMINRAGEKIMPSEVEKFFADLCGVKNCAALGIKDELLGEAICVFYEGDDEYTTSEVSKLFREKQIEDCCIPDRIIRVMDLPLTPVGKTDKNRLREMISDE